MKKQKIFYSFMAQGSKHDESSLLSLVIPPQAGLP